MNLGSGHQQQTVETKSCGFNLDGVPTQAAVTGPDDIVYVVEQPDSPIEIVSLDLTGTWLSVSGERYTEKICATYKVRNRSDRTIPAFDLGIVVNGAGGPAGSGWGTLRRSPLPPGQVVEVKSWEEEGAAAHPGTTCGSLYLSPRWILEIASIGRPLEYLVAWVSLLHSTQSRKRAEVTPRDRRCLGKTHWAQEPKELSAKTI